MPHTSAGIENLLVSPRREMSVEQVEPVAGEETDAVKPGEQGLAVEWYRCRG